MDCDDFIGLRASQEGNDGNGGEDSQGSRTMAGGSDRPTNYSHVSEGVLNDRNCARVGEGEDDPTVLDMDLEDEDIQQQPVLLESSESVEAKQDKDDVVVASGTNGILKRNILDDGLPATTGVKRARMMYNDQQPSVHVAYKSLTRESKRKLMELMQQWADWQAKLQLSSIGVENEVLEDGEETYFPALNVGSEKACTVSFWVDNQVKKGDELEGNSVPLYDRGYSMVSNSVDGSSNPQGLQTLEDSRCFNCGSYSHSLKECPKPRDNVAIANARKIHSSKRNQAASNSGPSRYYKKAPGKFDDLRAGVLGPEARECLGIGEHDPPPWFHRMRELGYPPGYLDIVEDEDQPSGITIYADEAKEEYEEGELPERAELEPQQRKMSVEFPGINAPIPENADQRRWATASSEYYSSNSTRNRVHHRSNHPSDNHRSHHTHNQEWYADPRDDGQSGSEYGLSSSFPGHHSPRYSPYDRNQIQRSPSLGRSISDRGWRSPVDYETSPGDNPRTPFLHSYHHPSRDRWEPDDSHGAIKDSSSQHGRDRRDHHHWR